MSSMMHLKHLLILLILAGWKIPGWTIYSTAGYALQVTVATVLIAAVIVMPSPSNPGKAEAFEFQGSLLLWRLLALAVIAATARVVSQLGRDGCDPFRECSWVHTFKDYAPVLMLAVIIMITMFWTIILAASFVALLFTTTLRFRAGVVSGCDASLDFLRSKHLKCAIAVAAMIGWYTVVISYELPMTVRLLLAAATAFLLAVSLLALPGPGGQSHRSISELGIAFVLLGAPVLATLIALHHNILGLDGRHGDLFVNLDLVGMLPQLHPALLIIPYAGPMSLEFYAIIVFAFLFMELVLRIEEFMKRKFE
jgi:hypothetical protein